MNGPRIPAHSASCQGAFDAVNLALTRLPQRSNETCKLLPEPQQPALRKNRNVMVDVADPLGNIGTLFFNHLCTRPSMMYAPAALS